MILSLQEDRLFIFHKFTGRRGEREPVTREKEGKKRGGRGQRSEREGKRRRRRMRCSLESSGLYGIGFAIYTKPCARKIVIIMGVCVRVCVCVCVCECMCVCVCERECE